VLRSQMHRPGVVVVTLRSWGIGCEVVESGWQGPRVLRVLAGVGSGWWGTWLPEFDERAVDDVDDVDTSLECRQGLERMHGPS
jgi:hypothetical protein